MEYISTDGLIVSVRDSGENDRLISMLTRRSAESA